MAIQPIPPKGIPSKKVAAPGESLKYFREIVIPYDGDDCLIWPYGKTTAGYGALETHEGKRYVHRLVCEMVHGPTPSKALHVAHGCGNSSCVNSRHLRWATRKENEKDKIEHGTRAMGVSCNFAKLTEEKVRAIRRMSGIPQKEVADIFGISQTQVSRIQSGRSWSHLK